MARKLEDLLKKMPPARKAKNRVVTGKMLSQMGLDELRKLKEITQVGLADKLEINQGALSRIERQADMHISTLRSIIEALGGNLTLRAEFPNGEAYTVSLAAQKEPHLATK